MSIRAKILLGCLSLTCVTVILGLLSRSAQQELGDIALNLYDDAFMSMSYLRSAQNTVVVAARDLATGEADPATIADQLDQAMSDLGVARERAMSAGGREQAEALLAEMALLSGKLRSTGALPGNAVMKPIEQSFDEAVEVYAGDGYRSRRAAIAVAERTGRRTWVAIGMSLVVALVITAILSRAIVPSVRHAVRIAAAIAAGRLNNHIDAAGHSETSTLLRALASMQASISNKIARIETLMAQQASSHADEVAAQNARFAAALDNMTQGLCMVGAEGQLQVFNRRFAEMFGSPAPDTAAIDALPAALRASATHVGSVAQAFTATLEDGQVISVSVEPMQDGGYVATYADISERYRAEARMQHMARHDALTGLPNRLLFREQADRAIALARRGGALAVLCLDLDRFKTVNDTLGHPAGDTLLRHVAARLRDEIRDTDTVARLGGDEFAIIQTSPTQPQDAKALAQRLTEVLSLPFDIDGQTVVIGTSIGIVVAVDGQETADGLLKSADLALYRAKADGRGTYRFFEAKMDATMQARRLLELDLRRAVAEQQFEVHYQPLVTTESGQVSGFEALVRWRHPTRGTVSPAEFIPVAEETGIIAAIGLQVLNQACDDAVHWPHGVKVAVNLSPLQFRTPDLVGDIAAALHRSGLPAQRLELEITESLLLQDSETVLAMLHQIRVLGVRISMDDFGTGYSSLSYLRRFPFDKIKIDQSFIRSLEADGDCMAIVRAVVGLGQSLGMSITAEGVETAEQLALLRQEGCHQVQGYLFSRPKPVDAVPSIIMQLSTPQLAMPHPHHSKPCAGDQPDSSQAATLGHVAA